MLLLATLVQTKRWRLLRLVQRSNSTHGGDALVPLISSLRYKNQQQMENKHSFQNVPRNESHRIYGKQVTRM